MSRIPVNAAKSDVHSGKRAATHSTGSGRLLHFAKVVVVVTTVVVVVVIVVVVRVLVVLAMLDVVVDVTLVVVVDVALVAVVVETVVEELVQVPHAIGQLYAARKSELLQMLGLTLTILAHAESSYSPLHVAWSAQGFAVPAGRIERSIEQVAGQSVRNSSPFTSSLEQRFVAFCVARHSS